MFFFAIFDFFEEIVPILAHMYFDLTEYIDIKPI